MESLTRQARLAHGDAWQVIGSIHAEHGRGRVARVPGGLLMASGLPHPQYNNVDVLDPGLVDVAELVRWYDDVGVPRGARVPAGAPWRAGRRLFGKRLMAMPVDRLVPPAADDRVEVSTAAPGDLGTVARLDVSAFGGDADGQRPWIGPLLGSDQVTVAIATWDGVPAGTGYAVRSDGLAGPAVYVAGIGVDPAYRRRGIAARLSAWLVAQAGPDRLAHLHPNTDDAARIYERLGFVEVPGFDVYVDITLPDRRT